MTYEELRDVLALLQKQINQQKRTLTALSKRIPDTSAKWKSLTREEMWAAWEAASEAGKTGQNIIETFTAAIEAKLKAKNHV